eukprot:m.11494 g.11494  ORF g.11494 m.11494 type:complete len:270 (-) comp8833_c0_seq1:151-960(-)
MAVHVQDSATRFVALLLYGSLVLNLVLCGTSIFMFVNGWSRRSQNAVYSINAGIASGRNLSAICFGLPRNAWPKWSLVWRDHRLFDFMTNMVLLALLGWGLQLMAIHKLKEATGFEAAMGFQLLESITIIIPIAAINDIDLTRHGRARLFCFVSALACVAIAVSKIILYVLYIGDESMSEFETKPNTTSFAALSTAAFAILTLFRVNMFAVYKFKRVSPALRYFSKDHETTSTIAKDSQSYLVERDHLMGGGRSRIASHIKSPDFEFDG